MVDVVTKNNVNFTAMDPIPWVYDGNPALSGEELPQATPLRKT